MKKTTIAALALTGFALPAFAQDAETSVLTEADVDMNGEVTLEEIQVVLPEVTEEVFMEADADASGTLTEDELTAAVEAGVITTSEG